MLLKEFHFDLILLDVHMKGIGFSDFLSYLDPLGDYSLIPVIAVTGVPDLISKKDKSNLSGILEKPFTPETMMSLFIPFIVELQYQQTFFEYETNMS